VPEIPRNCFIKAISAGESGDQTLLGKGLEYGSYFIAPYVRERVSDFFKAYHSIGMVDSIGQ